LILKTPFWMKISTQKQQIWFSYLIMWNFSGIWKF
jgi:hypothetical protein